MTELAERVANLERRMDDVEPLARATDQEVAGWRGVLSNHTKVLNTVRDDLNTVRDDLNTVRDDLSTVRDDLSTVRDNLGTVRNDQVEQGKRLARLERRVDDGFRQTNENFATVETKLGVLKAGMDGIKDLLTGDQADES